MTESATGRTGEFRVPLHGIELAVAQYGAADGPPLVALHGWLDNAGTWEALAARFPERRWLALDFQGHGRSDWIGVGAASHFVDHVDAVLALFEGLKMDRADLIGHSMGAAIGLLFTAAFPERVTSLTMIDGMGPLASPVEEVVPVLRNGLESRRLRARRAQRSYPEFGQIVERVRRAVPSLTEEAAHRLAARGALRDEEGWRFTADPRLRDSSVLRLTPEQVEHVFAAVRCPVLIAGAAGGPLDPPAEALRRLSLTQSSSASGVLLLPGPHHLHLTHPDSTAAGVAPFLRSSGGTLGPSALRPSASGPTGG